MADGLEIEHGSLQIISNFPRSFEDMLGMTHNLEEPHAGSNPFKALVRRSAWWPTEKVSIPLPTNLIGTATYGRSSKGPTTLAGTSAPVYMLLVFERERRLGPYE